MDKVDLCPVCLIKQDEFEIHHVVWQTDGGSNDQANLLKICKSCHSLISFGGKRERIPRDLYCFCLKLSEFGLSFLLKSNLIFSDTSPFGKDFVTKNANESAELLDRALRVCGVQTAQVYREIIKGEIELNPEWFNQKTTSTPLDYFLTTGD